MKGMQEAHHLAMEVQRETMVQSEKEQNKEENERGMRQKEEQHRRDNMQEQDPHPLEVEGMHMETVATSSGGWSIPPSCRFQTELDHSLAEAKAQTDHDHETGRPIIAHGAQPGRAARRRGAQGG